MTPVPDENVLSAQDLRRIDGWWRAANYLSVGQIFLRDNPLLKRPLVQEDLKPRLVGHWGTTPGLNLIYAHVNRLIKARDLKAIFIAGPGHGGPGVVANVYLEGTYSEFFPNVSQDEEGMKRLFKQFAFPGGVGSHAGPETPGSLHEGGELGYSLLHAYGAALDNPELLAVCVVGDGEAETGPLAASWHSNKFLNPSRDGAVLPILHLNGFKISNPTILARIPEQELLSLLIGYGYEPLVVAGDDPSMVHQALAAALDACAGKIAEAQRSARGGGGARRPRWPMIVLRTPKGWTGPKLVNGEPVEGTFYAHQFRMAKLDVQARVKLLEDWLRSYQPQELFDEKGGLNPDIAALAPPQELRMSASPYANGGTLLRDLRLPDPAAYAIDMPSPGAVDAEATVIQGRYIRDVLRLNSDRFRVFGPDETASNRWHAVFEADSACFMDPLLPTDKMVSPQGRVMEVLSEQLCQGWLEGYLLTGRHGFFTCYEPFIRIVDSMASQHAKWLDQSRRQSWRRPIASLNYLLTSHVWRQDHNGFSHMEPGFLDHMVNKKPELVNIYLPPDANTLLCVTDECLRSRHAINVIVAGKQLAPQWLAMDAARRHVAAGIGIWDWASTDGGMEPDIVMACCGDVPTLETLAAVELLLEQEPGLRIRVVNVLDLLTLAAPGAHPRALPNEPFDDLFTREKPVVFAFHGYPSLVDRLLHPRQGTRRFKVSGFREEGTTTTPFDMTAINGIDRWSLALEAIQALPCFAARRAGLRQKYNDKLMTHRKHIRETGDDMPEIRDWRWSLRVQEKVTPATHNGAHAERILV